MSQRTGRALAGARARWGTAGVAALAALALGACSKQEAAVPRAQSAVEVGPENIAVVTAGEIRTGPLISGTLEPRDAATVRAEVSGPVVQTYVERGQPVRRGQLLARIDDGAIREAYQSAQSAERSAKLSLDNATRDLERSRTLEQAGAIAQRDLEASQRALAGAQAAYADARARLASAEQQLQRTQIRSPLDGAVSERPVNAGDVVQPGTALVTVVDPSSMRYDASVPAEQIGALRVGAPVQFTVNGYPGRAFNGRVDRINPAADPTTRQVRISVSIPNKGSTLVAGLFAQGRVASESRKALLAPASAIDQRGVTPSVMRIRNGRAGAVPVEVGLRDEATEQVEIKSGLAAGDTLLVGAAAGVTPNTPVRVIGANDRTTAER